MQIQYVKNPVWANASSTAINLMVKFSAFENEVQFTASPNDTTDYGKQLFSEAVAEKWGAVGSFVPSLPSEQQLAAQVRDLRNQLLAETDWTDTLSAKNRLGEALYEQWQLYRQSLRDLTTQAGFPKEIIWPINPKS